MRVPVEWLKEYVTVRMSPEALAQRLTLAGLEVVGILRVDGEPVLDLEVTPNRADCLSILGVAREVAALTGQRLKPPPAHPTSGLGTERATVASTRRRADGGASSRHAGSAEMPVARAGARGMPRAVVIRVEDRAGCPRYIGRLIANVTVRPSPAWMQRRLAACGLGPINNVVDITNYVLLEYGQPLHAFDFERLAEGTICVRRARPHEPLTTLDGLARALTPDMLVIADARQAVAVAGIMGGTGSEVISTTRRILLESARFEPTTVRRTARALGLSTESSYRFERGVDPAGVEAASRRAASLLSQVAGGTEVLARDVGRPTTARTAMVVDSRRASRWLGLRLDPSAVRTTLARLGCRAVSSGSSPLVRVTPPSARQDLRREVDYYEELARLIGYERIPSTVPIGRLSAVGAPRAARYARLQTLRQLCASLGLMETITWSLVSERELSRIGMPADQATRLANPISQDHACLRPSLLPGAIRTIRHNLAQGVVGVRIFELGAVFHPTPSAASPAARRPALEAGAMERIHLGMTLCGIWTRDWRGAEPCDFFRLKGLLEAVAMRWAGGTVRFAAAAQPWAEPGHSATVQLNHQAVGTIGQLARPLLDAADIEQEAWFAELDLQGLLDAPPATAVSAPPQFPPVKRDLSLMVRAEVDCEAVLKAIRDAAGPLAQRIELIDRYTGPPVPPGQVSLTVAVEYRDPSRTLRAEAVEGAQQRIGQTLTQQLGATLRQP
jgi:phenylalanyl-tRNA synthetase beta chain